MTTNQPITSSCPNGDYSCIDNTNSDYNINTNNYVYDIYDPNYAGNFDDCADDNTFYNYTYNTNYDINNPTQYPTQNQYTTQQYENTNTEIEIDTNITSNTNTNMNTSTSTNTELNISTNSNIRINKKSSEPKAVRVTTIGQYSLPPLLSIIVNLDQVTVISVIQHHINWLENKPLTKHSAQWLHSLLALLEKPLDPDTASALRVLLRRASELRAKLTTPQDALLPPLNILITIVAKYFGQMEPDP